MLQHAANAPVVDIAVRRGGPRSPGLVVTDVPNGAQAGADVRPASDLIDADDVDAVLVASTDDTHARFAVATIAEAVSPPHVDNLVVTYAAAATGYCLAESGVAPYLLATCA